MKLRSRNTALLTSLIPALIAAGCSGDSPSPSATGGALVAGGTQLTGGAAITGGAQLTGGSQLTGGAAITGGAQLTGGSQLTGGGQDAGGTQATGGRCAPAPSSPRPARASRPGPPRSTFPSAAFGELDGSFTAKTITNTGPGNVYNIYHPAELGQDGVLHPVLTWGNGATTTPDLYPLLPNLASHGFVVIAAQNSFVDGPMLKDGLDWMLEQNTVSGSPFEGKLDPDSVGALGYSLGSLATFAIGTDPRLKTTVHISGGIMSGGDESQAADITHPTAYFCDADETGPNCDSDFAVVTTTPTFYGTSSGVHVDYMLTATFYERFNAAVIAWLRWQLMHDDTMSMVFEGSSCTLCQDSNWTILKKNMP